jgi:dethiobiotin synthetase
MLHFQNLSKVLEKKIYFITAIGTDIGKTFFIEKICQKLMEENELVKAIKPISSGFNEDDLVNSDSAKILQSLNIEINLNNINKINPWRFKASVSPHFASEIENFSIDFLQVIKFCQQKISLAVNEGSFLFIEGAGGVMTPINNNKNYLDLIEELSIPTLLITSNYLGSISHTLCAIESLKSKKIKLEKIIINQNTDNKNSFDDNNFIKTIKSFTDIETNFLSDLVRN